MVFQKKVIVRQQPRQMEGLDFIPSVYLPELNTENVGDLISQEQNRMFGSPKRVIRR